MGDAMTNGNFDQIEAAKAIGEMRAHVGMMPIAFRHVGNAIMGMIDAVFEARVADAARIAELEVDWRKIVAAITGNPSATRCDACRATGAYHCMEAFYDCAGMRDYTAEEVLQSLEAVKAREDEAQALIYAARQERDAAEDQEKELAEELRTVKHKLAELEANMAVLTANKDAAHHWRRENLARAEAAEAREATLREALMKIVATSNGALDSTATEATLRRDLVRVREEIRDLIWPLSAALQEIQP